MSVKQQNKELVEYRSFSDLHMTERIGELVNSARKALAKRNMKTELLLGQIQDFMAILKKDNAVDMINKCSSEIAGTDDLIMEDKIVMIRLLNTVSPIVYALCQYADNVASEQRQIELAATATQAVAVARQLEAKADEAKASAMQVAATTNLEAFKVASNDKRWRLKMRVAISSTVSIIGGAGAGTVAHISSELFDKLAKELHRLGENIEAPSFCAPPTEEGWYSKFIPSIISRVTAPVTNAGCGLLAEVGGLIKGGTETIGDLRTASVLSVALIVTFGLLLISVLFYQLSDFVSAGFSIKVPLAVKVKIGGKSPKAEFRFSNSRRRSNRRSNRRSSRRPSRSSRRPSRSNRRSNCRSSLRRQK